MFRKINKKAAIGAAMTWVVAIIIILFVIILFIYASYGLAKQKQITSFEPAISLGEQDYDAGTEQILLALLQTEIEGKVVSEYVLQGDYEGLKSKVKPFLEKLSEIEDCDFNLYVYEGDKIEKIKTSVDINAKYSEVYLDSNKKVKLICS